MGNQTFCPPWYYRVTIVRGRCPAGRTGTPRSRYLVRDAQQNLSRERERKFGTPSTTPSTSAMHFWGNRTEGGVTLSKQMRLVASGSVVRQRFFYGESAWCEMPPPSLKEGTYCSTVPTPPKKLYGSYTIYRVVFFGASSFGRFGRRGKTPDLNQGVFTDTPCVTLSQQESVVASPFALERNHQPCPLMRRRNWRGSRVVRGSPQR